MYQIIIRQPGAPEAEGLLPNGVYLVGSGEECSIRIERSDVSSRQLQLIVRDGRLLATDLGSTNGTFLDGNQLFCHQLTEVPPGGKIVFGKVCLLAVGYDVDAAQEAKPTTPAPAKAEHEKEEIPLLVISGIDPQARELVQEIKKRAHPELLKRLNLKKWFSPVSVTLN